MKAITTVLIMAAMAIALIIAFSYDLGVAAQLTSNDKRNIMRDCRVATGTKTRVSWKTNQPAADRCYNQVMANIRQAEIDQSYIDVNNAIADYFYDNTRPKNRRKR